MVPTGIGVSIWILMILGFYFSYKNERKAAAICIILVFLLGIIFAKDS